MGHFHPEFGRTTLSARGLWLTAASWCAAHSPEGVVPVTVVKEMLNGSDPQIKSLVKHGIWQECEDKRGNPAYWFNPDHVQFVGDES